MALGGGLLEKSNNISRAADDVTAGMACHEGLYNHVLYSQHIRTCTGATRDMKTCIFM